MNFSGAASRRVFVIVLPPTVVTLVLYLSRAQQVAVLEVLGSTLLLFMAWGSYVHWKDQRLNTIPLFAMLAGVYWTYYTPALYWGTRRYKSDPGALVSTASIEQAILMVLLGAACLWLGMRSGLGRRLTPRRGADITAHLPSSWHYVRLVLGLAMVAALVIKDASGLLGAAGRNALILLLTMVPMAAFALLFRRYLQGKAAPADKLLMLAFLASRFAFGISSGWLTTTVSIIVLCAATYLYERRRLPIAAALLLVPYVMFFQVGKQQFRRTFWDSRVEAGVVERISYWSNESLKVWSEALENPSAGSLRRVAEPSLGRLSLLQQSANVLDLTPSVVPYQHGRLYSYLAITLVPRALWPGKPTVNDANRFYQVAYGITEERNLDRVSVSVGILTESYINFGWAGVVLVMMAMGIFFDWFVHTFLEEGRGQVMNAVGLTLVPLFMAIEAQMAQYVGGLVQAVGMIFLVLLPVLRLTGRPEQQPALSPPVRQGLFQQGSSA